MGSHGHDLIQGMLHQEHGLWNELKTKEKQEKKAQNPKNWWIWYDELFSGDMTYLGLGLQEMEFAMRVLFWGCVLWGPHFLFVFQAIQCLLWNSVHVGEWKPEKTVPLRYDNGNEFQVREDKPLLVGFPPFNSTFQLEIFPFQLHLTFPRLSYRPNKPLMGLPKNWGLFFSPKLYYRTFAMFRFDIDKFRTSICRSYVILVQCVADLN